MSDQKHFRIPKGPRTSASRQLRRNRRALDHLMHELLDRLNATKLDPSAKGTTIGNNQLHDLLQRLATGICRTHNDIRELEDWIASYNPARQLEGHLLAAAGRIVRLKELMVRIGRVRGTISRELHGLLGRLVAELRRAFGDVEDVLDEMVGYNPARALMDYILATLDRLAGLEDTLVDVLRLTMGHF